MKEKLEKLRDNAHYSYRQLGVWQSSSAEDTKAIQKLKECVTLADSLIAELDSEELVDAIQESLECESNLAPLFNSTPETHEKQMNAAARAVIKVIKDRI